MANTTKLKPRRVNSFNEPSEGKNLWYKNDDQFNRQDWWSSWYQSFFKTQAEYDALPSSKNSDWNLYIIVDNHNNFLSWGELEEMWWTDALAYLNQRPTDCRDYYYSTGNVIRFDWAEYTGVTLPQWKYVYRYDGTYNGDSYDVLFCFQTNLTKEESEQYFPGGTQEEYEYIISWIWWGTSK